MADRTPVTQEVGNISQSSEPADAPKRRSVWTPKQKLIRLVWGTLGRLLWITFPGARSSILRLFGAQIGKDCSLARDVDIVVPWNICLGEGVVVENHAILYSLGMITIGNRCVLDSKAHLCAGTHDMTDPLFPLIRPPIILGEGCFIGFDAYVGPDVTLGDGTIVHPRTSVYRNTEPGTVWRGNPARPVEIESSEEGDEQ